QGMDALRTYMRKLEEEAASRGGSKASRKIVSHPAFIEARELLPQEVDHPKMEALERIVHNQLADNPDSRIIVFTHYRETAELVTERLNADPIIGAVRFVGQTCRGEDRGLSQKRQVEIIEAFKRGEYNVLVATSVAEEGLDIPSTDLVVFFEPVSSEIRTIQRRGRTGRRRVGRVVILISGGTRDEAYYWSSTRKERNMKAELDRIRRMLREGVMAEGGGAETRTATGPPEGADGRPDDDGTTIPDDPTTTRPASPLDDLMARGARDAGAVARAESSEEVQKSQATLDRYAVDIRIIADMREFRSPVVKEISRHGILVEGRQLEVGDYILSSRLAVERKTAEDLAASIVDGRLFQQMKALASAYPTPVIIVEGAVFSTRVPETALMGALGALVVDFRIPVINTSSPDETAALLVAMAKREAKGRRTPAVRPGRVSRDPEDRKQYVIEGLPNVSGVLARRLLEHFGSVRAVMNATEEELMQVKGLGRMKAAGIVRILEEEWRG
ncbi:MAG TPA: hypothetical protein EYP43_03545, partial [Thermoplasmata archaeon]|nr:hypothetical protein [Thermoplasmata archaeon]